ncbi:MAG: hypothetical protein IPN76_08385 [Saprospiraceae bacterium]|nr:hypothetical protein [Saprospiraceae bacterium]
MSADSLLTGVKAYLRRKTSLGYHKEHYLSLVHYSQKLLGLNPHDRKAAELLRSELEEAKHVLEKDWLLGRLID